MKTIIFVSMFCAFAGSPGEAAPIPQEEETREFRVFDGEDLHSITLLVQQLTGRRMMWTDDIGLENKRINFSLEKPLGDPGKIFRVYQSFLSMNDLILVPIHAAQEGESYYKIQLASTAPKRGIPVVTGKEKPQDRFVSRIFLLQYVSPRDAHAALINMTTFPHCILQVESAGALLISDYDYNMERISHIIVAMDQPERRERVEVIPVRNRKVGEIYPLLEKLVERPKEPAEAKGRGSKPSVVVRILADEVTNSLIVRGDRAWLEKIRGIVADLDGKK